MSIKRTIITTIVALALVAVVAPGVGVAQSTTIAQLQAQINALLAQLQSLQGGPQTAGTGGTGACTGVTFTRNLTVGSTGSDVKCLQQILNQSSVTQVSVTGAGAPGNETTTFGQKTLAAVKKYQAAAGLTPANQVGPMTRAKLNAALGAVVIPGQPPVITPTGSISAMTALDTPAAGAVVTGQATADLLHINFTGTGTVTSVTLQRSGVSDQNTLTAVYLYDGNTRLTDGYSFNINGSLTMNGLSIPVNGSHVVSVKADVYSLTSYSSDPTSSVAVGLTGFTGNGAAMSSSVMGNVQMIALGSLATAYLGADSVVSTSTSPTTVNAGTTQQTVWSSPVQINTRAVYLKGASFRIIGSAPTNALANVRLFVDGVDTGKLATLTSTNGSSYETFDLTSSPITLTTGSHTVDVRADIVSGASRFIQLSVQQASDLVVFDPQVGVNIAVLGASGVAFTPNLGAYLSISAGTGSVVVDPTFTSATNVPAGASNAVIGRFVVHGYGENVKVSSVVITPSWTASTRASVSSVTIVNQLASQQVTVSSTSGFVAGNAITTTDGGVGTIVSIDSATTMTVIFTTLPGGTSETITVADKGLNNVTLYFNGSQISSQQSPTAMGALTFQLGSQMIVPAGQDSTLEVRADLQQQSTSTAYGAGTIVVAWTLSSGNAQGQSSFSSASVPSSTVTTSGLSISGASLAVSKNSAYSNQAVSPNQANQRIGSFVLQNQSTSESIRLTTLTVALTSDGSTVLNTTTGTKLTGLASLRTSDTTGSGSTPIQPTTSNTFSVSDVLAPGASMVIDVLANTGSSTDLTAVVTKLTVASIGVSSNISSAGTATTGQTISLSSGTIASAGVTLVTSPTSTTSPQFIAAGPGNHSQATFNFVATSAPATITELKFVVSDDTSTMYSSVTNVCVGSSCAQPVSGIADITGLSLVVPTGQGLNQPVQVTYNTVGLTGLTPGTKAHVTLAYVKYTSGGSTSTLCAGNYSTVCSGGTSLNIAAGVTAPSSSTFVFLASAVPVVTVASSGGHFNDSAGAVTDVAKVTVSSTSPGSVKVRQITFNVGFGGFSSGPGIDTTATKTYLVASGTNTTVAPCLVASVSGGSTVTCKFTSDGAIGTTQTYADDVSVSANSPASFDLYTTLIAAGTAGTGVLSETATLARASSASDTAAFRWDDTSTAGGAGYGPYNDYYLAGYPINSATATNQ